MLDWLYKKEQWCCQPFQKLYDARYDRGLFVFVRPSGWGGSPALSFWLAFRSILQQNLPQVISKGFLGDVPLTISTSRRIIRCPWCGEYLESFYQEREAELVDQVIIEEFELPAN